MADMTLPPRRSALAACLKPGKFGAQGDPADAVRFSERAGRFILQADFKPASEAPNTETVAKALDIQWPESPQVWSGKDNLAVLPAGPGRYWIVGDESQHKQHEVENILADQTAAVFDLSHGRTIIRVSGRNTRTMLAKGTGIDLDPSGFGENAAAMTQLFHIAVTITAVDTAPAFDIYVARGFAETLWERLTDAALEYGYEV